MSTKRWSNSMESWYGRLFLATIISLFLPIAINSMCIGFMGILWIVSAPWKRIGSEGIPTTGLLMIGFYLLHIIGMIYTADVDEGLTELEQKLAFLILPLFIFTGPRLKKETLRSSLRAFYHTCTLLLAAAVIFGLYRWMTYDTELGLLELITYRHFTLPVGFDPIYLGLYTAAALLFILFEKVVSSDLRSWNRPGGWVWLQVLFLFIALIFISSRAEILIFGMIAAGLALALTMRSEIGYRPIIVLGIIFGIAVGVVASNPVNRARFVELFDMSSDYTENQYGGRSFRLAKWSNAVECWASSPVIGVGTGDVMDELLETYKKNDFMEAYNGTYNPHNQYLQTAIGLGIPGFILLVLLVLYQLRRSIRIQDLLYFSFVLLYGLSMMSESMLERQKGIVFIVLFACLFALKDKLSGSNDESLGA